MCPVILSRVGTYHLSCIMLLVIHNVCYDSARRGVCASESSVHCGVMPYACVCLSLHPLLFVVYSQVLAKLNEIAPPTKQPLQRQYSDIDQLGSLGVLYISASSSMLSSRDQGQEQEEAQMEEAVDQALRAQQMELLPNLVVSNSTFRQQQQKLAQQQQQQQASQQQQQAAQQQQQRELSVDFLVAQELQSEEDETAVQRQIENDAYLAAQLQQKDYSYPKPADPSKTVPKIGGAMQPGSSHNQGMIYDRTALRKTPRGEMWERQWRGEPIPPPAPPPPPLPPSVASPAPSSPNLIRSRPLSKSINSVATSEAAKLKQLVYLFPRVKLNPVVTVEKTVFPVGECWSVARA